jgi:membrane-associated phospholipid phosphatase
MRHSGWAQGTRGGVAPALVMKAPAFSSVLARIDTADYRICKRLNRGAASPLVLPLAAVIGASRVVLGLHYPTDLIAGALIGAALAQLGLAFS